MKCFVKSSHVGICIWSCWQQNKIGRKTEKKKESHLLLIKPNELHERKKKKNYANNDLKEGKELL